LIWGPLGVRARFKSNHQDAIGNLAICYRAFCLSRLDRRADGVESLFSFTRDKKRSSQAPNNLV
jgi:hypothetical protein